MNYKSDSGGFWQGHFRQVVVVDVKSGELTHLTSDENDVSVYSWSPDGKYLAVDGDFSEDGDLSFNQDVIYSMLLPKSSHL